MSRPIYEPSDQRTAARLNYGQEQLFRRPSRPNDGVAIYEIKVFEDAVAVVTGDDAFVWEIPEDLDGAAVVKVEAFITTAGGSTTTIQIRQSDPCDTGSNILSTAITIETGECNSKDATTQPVIIDPTVVAWGDHMHIDVDAAGSGSMGLGVMVTLAPAAIASVILQGAQGAQGPAGADGTDGTDGTDGAPGGIVNWTGEWDVGTAYVLNDAVSWQGSSYVAIAGSTAVEPGVTGGWESSWMLLSEGVTTLAATDVTVADAGGYFAGTEAETVLQDLGLTRYDGWVPAQQTWTYATALTFTITGDVAAQYPSGTRLKLTQTTVKYFTVYAALHSAGTTTVTIIGNNDYTLANAAISANFYSYASKPQGYPTWFNFSPSYAGFSANPSSGICRFSIFGNVCHFKHSRNDGTSNATSFTITLPVATLSNQGGFGGMTFPCRFKNNGTGATTPGMVELVDSSSTITIYRDWGGTTWTAANAKNAIFTITFEF